MTLRENSPIYSIQYSPNGQLLLSGTEDSTVTVWEKSTGKSLSKLTDHSNVVYSMAFNPEGSLLATGSFDNSIRLWNIRYEVPPTEKLDLNDWFSTQRDLFEYEIKGLQFNITPPQINLFGKHQPG